MDDLPDDLKDLIRRIIPPMHSPFVDVIFDAPPQTNQGNVHTHAVTVAALIKKVQENRQQPSGNTPPKPEK